MTLVKSNNEEVYLESKLREYLAKFKPSTFSMGNKDDVSKFGEWLSDSNKLDELKQELKELRIKAQPINTAIYLKESEILELEEKLNGR